MGDTADARTDLVVFGASGDLAARKILPALRKLSERGELRAPLRVIGVGRSDLSDQPIQEQLGEPAHAAISRANGYASAMTLQSPTSS
jgi:glucose-6-phosphate 1-dehydrogenase